MANGKIDFTIDAIHIDAFEDGSYLLTFKLSREPTDQEIIELAEDLGRTAEELRAGLR